MGGGSGVRVREWDWGVESWDGGVDVRGGYEVYVREERG